MKLDLKPEDRRSEELNRSLETLKSHQEKVGLTVVYKGYTFLVATHPGKDPIIQCQQQELEMQVKNTLIKNQGKATSKAIKSTLNTIAGHVAIKAAKVIRKTN